MTRVLNLETGEYQWLTDEEFARLCETEPGDEQTEPEEGSTR